MGYLLAATHPIGKLHFIYLLMQDITCEDFIWLSDTTSASAIFNNNSFIVGGKGTTNTGSTGASGKGDSTGDGISSGSGSGSGSSFPFLPFLLFFSFFLFFLSFLSSLTASLSFSSCSVSTSVGVFVKKFETLSGEPGAAAVFSLSACAKCASSRACFLFVSLCFIASSKDGFMMCTYIR